MENQWTTGLFSCMEDDKTACVTFFCPCVTFGRIADIADEGKYGCEKCGIFYGLICCVVGLPCLFSCTYRTKIRSKLGLPESPASDCLTHCFCECCALCQEYRELKNRGLDPSIGWNGNMQQTMAPRMSQHALPPMDQHAPPAMSQHAPPSMSQQAPPVSQHMMG